MMKMVKAMEMEMMTVMTDDSNYDADDDYDDGNE